MRCLRGLLFVSFFLPASVKADEPKARDVLEAFQKQLATAAATAGPSIACIVVSRSEHYPKIPGQADTPGKLGTFDPKAFLKSEPTPERVQLAKALDLSDPKSIPDHGYAGGMVIDAAGLILTPCHAIDGATRIYVFLPGGVGSYADIHAADARCDLAVLKLINPPEKVTPIKFAEVRTRDEGLNRATVFTGKLVILMANPYSSTFRLDAPSAAFGSITNIHHRLTSPEGKSSPAEKLASHYKCGTLFEHDVKVNGGVTGGALLNLDGELLGLTTVAAVVYNREIGPGYAIPADENFRRLVDVLRRGEEIEYGFLGVILPRDDTSLPIILLGVTQNSPAHSAGLRERDRITRINGHPAATFDDLLLHIGSALAGSTVKLRVSRGGQERDVDVTLAKFPNDRPYIASVRPEPVFGLRVDYGSIHSVDSLRIAPGICVREIVPDSPAEKRFKALGDDPKRWSIIQVNGAGVATPAEFYKAAKGQKKIDLTLLDPRDPSGRERELTLP
jgi:serine protease Do